LQKFRELVGRESKILGGGRRGVMVGMVETVETVGFELVDGSGCDGSARGEVDDEADADVVPVSKGE
jgi:hypothetical protein